MIERILLSLNIVILRVQCSFHRLILPNPPASIEMLEKSQTTVSLTSYFFRSFHIFIQTEIHRVLLLVLRNQECFLPKLLAL